MDRYQRLPQIRVYAAHAYIAHSIAAGIGLYLYVGLKHGQWHDVGSWRNPLQTATPPIEIVVFSEASFM